MVVLWVLAGLLGWCLLALPLAVLVGRSLAGRDARSEATSQVDVELVA